MLERQVNYAVCGSGATVETVKIFKGTEMNRSPNLIQHLAAIA